MHEPNVLPPRSRLLCQSTECILVIVDIQEKLAPLIQSSEDMVRSVQKLARGAEVLAVPLLVSEQYPEKLGTTIQELGSMIPKGDAKRMFSCRELFSQWESRIDPKRRTVVLCGIESHVCILQTCLDYLSLGWEVMVPVDAIGSQSERDHELALRRMETSGATLTTTQSLLFEWTETSLHPRFREISAIVKS